MFGFPQRWWLRIAGTLRCEEGEGCRRYMTVLAWFGSSWIVVVGVFCFSHIFFFASVAIHIVCFFISVYSRFAQAVDVLAVLLCFALLCVILLLVYLQVLVSSFMRKHCVAVDRKVPSHRRSPTRYMHKSLCPTLCFLHYTHVSRLFRRAGNHFVVQFRPREDSR